jgi:hypothetical protein
MTASAVQGTMIAGAGIESEEEKEIKSTSSVASLLPAK